ncbi:class I SAM-dependent methyltransferase [Streptomyces achromogenes]|uniref:class I SAM-dependent methyltransferase n=1 Tax=Streptomyces achromogenes TaxID=67255 RepID=UPI0036F52216
MKVQHNHDKTAPPTTERTYVSPFACPRTSPGAPYPARGRVPRTRCGARRAPRGRALGFDLSAPTPAEARTRADTQVVGNVSFVQGDAQVCPFEAVAFDAAVSRCGVMFSAAPIAAYGTIGRALRPGGRRLRGVHAAGLPDCRTCSP